MGEETAIDKYLRRPGGIARNDSQPAAQPGFEANGEYPLPMVDLVQANGNRLGLPYCDLHAVQSHSDHLVLLFTEDHVTIHGRNLLPVYNHLLQHTVRRLTESANGFDEGSTTTWIQKIELTKRER
jgi:hypothetical protein